MHGSLERSSSLTYTRCGPQFISEAREVETSALESSGFLCSSSSLWGKRRAEGPGNASGSELEIMWPYFLFPNIVIERNGFIIGKFNSRIAVHPRGCHWSVLLVSFWPFVNALFSRGSNHTLHAHFFPLLPPAPNPMFLSLVV